MNKSYYLVLLLLILIPNYLIAQKESTSKVVNQQRLELVIEHESLENETIPNSTASLNPPDTINSIIEKGCRTEVFLKGNDFTCNEEESSTKNGTKAGPVNDDICDAIELSLDSTCLSLQQDNDHSDKDFFGGCIPNGVTSIFYKFTVAENMDMFSITMNNFLEPYGVQLYFMLLEGLCTDPTIISVECTYTPYVAGGSHTQAFYNLVPGTEYFIMIGTQPGEGNWMNGFDMCFEDNIAPPLITGPEQDCFGAIPVCDFEYTQENSYTGIGDIDDLIDGTTCLEGGESNSVWYVFTPQTNGDMAFEITTDKDYDWALYNLTDIGGCANIPGATPDLCNYSSTQGNTGTVVPVNATIPRSVDNTGLPTMPGMPVTAGETYALLINNYTADANGYTLTFDVLSPGTASIADNPPATGAYPSLSSASVSCTDSIIIVNMSEHIDCLSIGQNDFLLTNTTTSTSFTSAISFIEGGNCNSSELTTSLNITHDGSLTTGVYELEVNAGATITDKCGNLIQIGGIVTFNYLAELSLTASETSICGGESINLDADGADGSPSVVTYTLNPGGSTNTSDGIFTGLTPAITTTYTISATYGGCTRTATETVNVEGNIIVSINPASKTVCDFASALTLTASTTINGAACGACTFTWSTTETTASIDVSAAGTYTVSSVTPSGCASFNTASSVIALAGAGTGGGSCDVLYVSPGGTGDGYAKETPTTLDDAVDKALCTNTTIKMEVGVYTLSNFQYVPSYITIEGGYNSDFTTKSSDMSGGSNSTTIRRTSSYDIEYRDDPDTEYTTDCSAFRVESGAELFRIQNLRIEMPGSTNVAGHAASSGLKNYGIKLGPSCENYNIVRCYIDAGVGATP